MIAGPPDAPPEPDALEDAQAWVLVHAAADAVERVAERESAPAIRLGVCMPGLSTQDGRGIRASYAVPGAQLDKGAAVYRSLADAGAEFLNHGSRPHAEWRGDRYYGITFYNEMSTEDVQAAVDALAQA